jgi:hypothetical protein
MATEYVNIGLTAIGSASITLLFAYFSYRVKIEARFKDLENEVKLLEPLKRWDIFLVNLNLAS